MSMFGYIGGYGMDPLWFVFLLPGLLLGLYAQFKLKSAYGRYIEVPLSSGLSGAEVARQILDSAGLASVPIEVTPGQLSDHYDPTRRALVLSEENYYGRSIAAAGVAAHESGHALQHKAAYFPLHFRMTLVPVTNFASGAAFYAAMFGFALALPKLVLVGIIGFSIMLLFQVVTLPVEFDASSRAKKQLQSLGLVGSPEEARGVSKVLSAAAMTYVAGMVSALFQLLYFILRFSQMRSSERES
jgi:Zn-dependent membrane protease YugP